MAQRPERLVVEVPPRRKMRAYFILTLIPILLALADWIILIFTPYHARIGVIHQIPTFSVAYMSFIFLFSLWFPFFREKHNNLDQRRQEAAATSLASRNEPDTTSFTLSDYPHIAIDRSSTIWPIVFICIMLLAIIGFTIYIASTWLEQIPTVVSHGYFSVWSVLNMLLDCAYLVPFTLCVIVLSGLIIDYQQQIIATSNGLISQQGEDVNYIPWHEARLFTMLGSKQASNGKPLPPVFELASSSQSIRWTIGRGQQMVPYTFSLYIRPEGKRQAKDEALIKQFETLHTIVVSHTGLPLQDLRT